MVAERDRMQVAMGARVNHRKREAGMEAPLRWYLGPVVEGQ